MVKIAPTKYVKPESIAKANPLIEFVKPFTDQGIDTAFEVTFEAKDYQAEKLLIQSAVRELGFSSREVVSTWDDEADYDADSVITSTFLVRPARVRKPAEEAEAAAE